MYDYSKVGLKLVLPHNGKKFPSAPLAHTAKVKEFYENIKLLLEKIQYEKYNWNVCGDLKVNYLLLGYTKLYCVLLSGTVGTENIIKTKKIGLKENSLFQDRKV